MALRAMPKPGIDITKFQVCLGRTTSLIFDPLFFFRVHDIHHSCLWGAVIGGEERVVEEEPGVEAEQGGQAEDGGTGGREPGGWFDAVCCWSSLELITAAVQSLQAVRFSAAVQPLRDGASVSVTAPACGS